MKSLIVVIILIFGISSNSFSQDRPVYFVQFKIVGVSSANQAKSIDKKIMGKKGILSTHTDHITSTFFCTLEAEAAYVFEDFQSWFSKIGYEIACFNIGQQGAGAMISPHELKNCEENNNN